MSYRARILADSVSPDGVRLTTLEATFPRIMLSEFNTHRVLSRNSASSRAIPPEKQIDRVMQDPFVPVFGSRVKGMGQGDDLTEDEQARLQREWKRAARQAALAAEYLCNFNADKSHTNRLLEPFLWHTVIVSATEWSNFFALRTHEAAAPEIREIATLMKSAMDVSEPSPVREGEWHLPLVAANERTVVKHDRDDFWRMVSVGRCARVSYETHEDKESPQASYNRAVLLGQNGHWSPFEHVACPAVPLLASDPSMTGNFRGWIQYRKLFANENDASKMSMYAPAA